MVKSFIVGSALLTLSLLFLVTNIKTVDAKCGAQKPSSAPQLLSAVPADSSVTLTWAESTGPLTHYVLSYGNSPTTMEYGNPNIGPQGTTSFTIDHLTNGRKYYFKIMAVNGCKPSAVSDKLSAVPGNTMVVAHKTGPVLSIYKSVPDSTAAAKEKDRNTHTKVAAATASLAGCTATCTSWKLLITEGFLLVLFFSIARKFKSIKSTYSLLIPLILSIIFIKTTGSCISTGFYCKYFYPLNFMIYTLGMIIYKHTFTHKKQKPTTKKKTKGALAIA